MFSSNCYMTSVLLYICHCGANGLSFVEQLEHVYWLGINSSHWLASARILGGLKLGTSGKSA